jgi:hypothetical protein
MEVTVGGMDAAVEPIGIYSRRVTGMRVVNELRTFTHKATNGKIRDRTGILSRSDPIELKLQPNPV